MSVPAQNSASQSNLTPPRIDFKWIGQAWSLASAQLGVWVGAMLLFFLVNAAAWLLLAIPTGVFASLRDAYNTVIAHALVPSAGAVGSYQKFAQTQVFNILLAAVSAVFAGGLYRMALRQMRGEPISPLNLFSALPQSLPLLLVGAFAPAVLGLLEGGGLWLLHFSLTPARAVSVINIAFWLPDLLLTGLFLFAPFLVIDTKASAPAALLGSIRLLGRQWLRGIGFYIAASFIGGFGALLCGVGMLATYPICIFSITTAYLALTQSVVTDTPAFDPAPEGVWPPPPRVPQENQL